MTVSEMIAWLSTQSPDATVVIEDVDTDWALPLRVGSRYHSRKQPENSVIVHGLYEERIWDEE